MQKIYTQPGITQKTNPRMWWKHIKNLSGLTTKSEWYHQFLDNNTNNKTLADKTNNFFVSIADHLHNFT